MFKTEEKGRGEKNIRTNKYKEKEEERKAKNGHTSLKGLKARHTQLLYFKSLSNEG
jgi:hypothetical protein